MASKLNRKFLLVVIGFSAAAILLLTAVVLVNQLWLKNAERHIRAGDELLAQGKAREAYGMYGRAVSKKPESVEYVGKMEEALGKVVANTGAQSIEDYRNLMMLKRARTRAQPGDPEQWRILMDALEDEAELFARGEGWLAIEGVAKEMKDAMPPGSDGLKSAEEALIAARAERQAVLTAGERSDLERQAEAFIKVNPKSWRGWGALAGLRIADVGNLRNTGQESAAVRRLEQLDRTIADMKSSVDGNDPRARYAMALVELDRATLDSRVGNRIERSKLDKAKVAEAAKRLGDAAVATDRSLLVRQAAGRMIDCLGVTEAAAFLDTWTAAHPADLLSASYLLEFVSRMGDQEGGADRVRAVARRILDQPTLPTSLMASVQPETRARAIQVLIESAITAGAREGVDPARKADLDKEVMGLRGELLKALQNEEAAPGMLAADAKILQSRGDLAGAAKKWETYFSKVPQPPADAFLWSTLVSRAQGDLGLAMQTVTRGTEAHPTDLRLVIQRAELAAQLGRFPEAASLFEAVAKALPEEDRFARFAADARMRAEGGRAQQAPEVEGLDQAIRAKDWTKARELAAKWVETSSGALQALYAQALVEQEAGDRAKALQFVRAALDKSPPNIDMARMEATLATDDPFERVEMMIARMVPDPKQRPAERVRALRGLRDDLERQLVDLRRSGSADLPKVEGFITKVTAALADSEKELAANGGDPAAVEVAFVESLERRDFAAAELHVAAAAKLGSASPALETVLRARLLDAQGKTSEAIAYLEKARQSGRTEAPVATTLAAIQERIGNEPAALALWKEAYDRRPNDLANVRGYARALGRSAQGRQGLEMLRAAVSANPADVDTLTLAAEYEAVYGGKSKAVDHRERVMQLDSSNRQNIADLYVLLHLPPDFGSVRDDRGRPRYDARTWAAVPPDEQRRLLADARRLNVETSERLYEATMRIAPYDMRMAQTRAAVLRDEGKTAEAIATLRTVLDRAEADGKATASMYLEQALFLDGLGERAAADAALAKARPLQDPKRREADFTDVELQARRGDPKSAAKLLAAIVEDQETLPGLLRLADLYLLQGDAASARATLDRIRPLIGSTPTPETQRLVEMVAVGIASFEAEALRADGKLDEAMAKMDEALVALSRAEAAAPLDLLAPLRRVQFLRSMAVARQDKAKLDAAIAEADRTLARNALYWPMVSLRADLSLDKRDIRAALGVIERFMSAQPGSDEARTRLMDMLIAAGNVPSAVEVARAGVELRPQDPKWAERLGDLLGETGDSAAAASEYERAFSLDPRSLPYLEKSASARLATGNAAEALALLRGAADLVQQSPVLKAVFAAALARTGRRDEGLVAGREALAAARAATGDDSLRVLERTCFALRELFPQDRVAEFEAFMTQVGEPGPVECALLAVTWSRGGPQGADKAIGWCVRVEAMGDKAPVGVRAACLLTKGTALYGKGDNSAAADAFVEAATLAPGSAEALNNAAYLLTRTKRDPAKAMDFAARAVLLEPAQPDYLDTFGYVLLNAGKLAEAEDALAKSIAASPSANSLLHLAQLRAVQGNFTEARQVLDRARARPSDPETKKDIDDFASTLQGK